MEPAAKLVGGKSQSEGKIGSVMVVGAGIAGIQASLDLADSGYFVYLVEKSSALGGTMPMLDKTFPTHDCSLCILSPKLVECGRHPNIRIFTGAELVDIQGEAGNFRLTLRCQPRFVDPTRCKNCGQCAAVCPVRVPDEFNQGLDFRPAIYKPYPQAFPDSYTIDPKRCKRCRACEKICPSGAIDLDQKVKVVTLSAGAVIFACGFEQIDPRELISYGYGRFANVLTSLEVERLLSAGGPSGGNLLRPSDKRKPAKIAWIQCAGSRTPAAGRGWCSSVCCRSAIKQAILAKEQAAAKLAELDAAIFYLDIRAYSKGLEQYYTKARDLYGVRFIRSRISELIELQDGRKNLLIRYLCPEGGLGAEVFDLVVLSLGFRPPAKAVELAQRLGIEINPYGFAEPTPLSGVETLRSQIFVAGSFAWPQCISETVTQAMAAAAVAGSCLDEVRGSMVREKRYPEQKSKTYQEPRLGVFVCHCGTNISQVVRVAEVVEAARHMPKVVYAADCLHACSQDSQIAIREAVIEHNLSHLLIAACSPATHGPLFQETAQEAGLNKYLCDVANIRNQCAWVHKDLPEEATNKAKELVRMKVAKLALQEPIWPTAVSLTRAALVIGGGISGMSCALTLAAESGFEVHLVEKSNTLGGMASKIHQGFRGENIPGLVDELIDKVLAHPRIKTYLSVEPVESCGGMGNCITTLSDGQKIRHGVIILATGGQEYKPSEYLYGQSERIMTYLELDQALAEYAQLLRNSRSIVLINCVGSRQPDRPYCSRVCCHTSIRLALALKSKYPDLDIFILYRHMRTYGFMEDQYRKARLAGATFIRYQPEQKPVVEKTKQGSLRVTVIDHVLRRPLVIEPDLVALAAAILPAEDNPKLSRIFKVPLDEHGFFLEAHLKLRPVDFAAKGVFLAGVAHGPKNVEENLIQAKAAAGRAACILSKKTLESQGIVARIDQDKCVACLTCTRLCLFNAPRVEDRAIEIDPSLCQGCGTCVYECPNQAITLQGYDDRMYSAMTECLSAGVQVRQGEFEPKIVAFCCTYCAYAAADLAGTMRLQYPPNVRIIEVPCSGDVGEQVLIRTFEHGADGVFVAGCLEGSCHFLQGNCRARKRVEAVKKILDEIGLGRERVEMYNLSSAMGQQFAQIAQQITERIRRLGPNPFSRAG